MKPRPTQAQRSRPFKPSQNRVRNTSLSTAARKSTVQTPQQNLECRSPNAKPETDAPNQLHPSPNPDSPNCKTQASQTPSQDKGILKFNKSPGSAADRMSADLSKDSHHILEGKSRDCTDKKS